MLALWELPLILCPLCFFSARPFSLTLPPWDEWAPWGWWPVTERGEPRLSTLSDSQSGRLTAEQFGPSGTLSLLSLVPRNLLSPSIILSQWQQQSQGETWIRAMFTYYYQRFSIKGAFSPSIHHQNLHCGFYMPLVSPLILVVVRRLIYSLSLFCTKDCFKGDLQR